MKTILCSGFLLLCLTIYCTEAERYKDEHLAIAVEDQEEWANCMRRKLGDSKKRFDELLEEARKSACPTKEKPCLLDIGEFAGFQLNFFEAIPKENRNELELWSQKCLLERYHKDEELFKECMQGSVFTNMDLLLPLMECFSDSLDGGSEISKAKALFDMYKKTESCLKEKLSEDQVDRIYGLLMDCQLKLRLPAEKWRKAEDISNSYLQEEEAKSVKIEL